MKVKYQFPILVVVLILIILTPLGIPYLIPTPSNDYIQGNNITCFGCDDVYDPLNPILLFIVIPIFILISVIIKFYPFKIREVPKHIE